MDENIVSIFKEKKLKLTPQRLAVYNYLMSTDTHPSAETIYAAISEQYPTMSLATVYKALKTLASVNLIQELNVGEGNFRYDGTVTPHIHIQCLKCGKVNDIFDISLNSLVDEAQHKSDYTIVSNQVYFYGYCPNCK